MSSSMEIKLQQQFVGTAKLNLTVSEFLFFFLRGKKPKNTGEEKLSIYIKESQV